MATQRKRATETPLEKKISEIRESADAYNTALDHSRSALYDLIAKLLSFTKMVLVSEHRADFERACENDKVTIGNNSNVYLPIVQLIFRKSEKNGKTKPDASAYKYAKVVRHLMEKGIGEDEVVDYIAKFNHSKHGKRLDGIIKADAAAHPDNRGGNDNFIDRIAGMKERNAENNFGSVAVPANSNVASYRNLVVMLGETDGSSITVRSFLSQQKPEDIVRIIAAFATKKQEAAEASKTMWDANE